MKRTNLILFGFICLAAGYGLALWMHFDENPLKTIGTIIFWVGAIGSFGLAWFQEPNKTGEQ